MLLLKSATRVPLMRFPLEVLISIQPLLANLHLRTAPAIASTNAVGVQADSASDASRAGEEASPPRSAFAKVQNDRLES